MKQESSLWQHIHATSQSWPPVKCAARMHQTADGRHWLSLSNLPSGFHCSFNSHGCLHLWCEIRIFHSSWLYILQIVSAIGMLQVLDMRWCRKYLQINVLTFLQPLVAVQELFYNHYNVTSVCVCMSVRVCLCVCGSGQAGDNLTFAFKCFKSSRNPAFQLSQLDVWLIPHTNIPQIVVTDDGC